MIVKEVKVPLKCLQIYVSHIDKGFPSYLFSSVYFFFNYSSNRIFNSSDLLDISLISKGVDSKGVECNFKMVNLEEALGRVC